MKRIKSSKSIISIVLLFTLVIQLFFGTLPVYAGEDEANELNVGGVRTEADSELNNDFEDEDILGAVPDEMFNHEEDLVEYLREQFKNHVEEFVYDYYAYENLEDDYFRKDVIEKALKHSGKPDEGDYLRVVTQGKALGVVRFRAGQHYVHRVLINVRDYFTTKEQEEYVDRKAAEIIDSLNLEGMSDLRKIQAIYNYVCKNVTYDYDHLSDESYRLQYTAYAALHDHTAVCSGYAHLFYNLCLRAGIDCRIIHGEAGNFEEGPNYNVGRHAWNIVKLGDVYYNVDSTWDSNHEPPVYFLKSEKTFLESSRIKHIPDEEYLTDSFKAEYPMAAEDYVVPVPVMLTSIFTYNAWLNVGETTKLQVNFYGTLTKDDKFELLLNDEDLVSISDDYIITAKKPGVLKIECRLNGVKSNMVVTLPIYEKAAEWPFKDISQSETLAPEVLYAYENGIVGGYPATDESGKVLFKPDKNVTRAHFAIMIYNLAGKPDTGDVDFDEYSFVDVPADSSGYKEIAWAASKGIISGFSGGRFKPANPVTRTQMAIMLKGYSDYMGYQSLYETGGTDIRTFADYGEIPAGARADVQWAMDNKVLSGITATKLKPNGYARRDQCAAILARFHKKFS
ncbi:MAG: S-layer homology domain-containing protein [Eubacterium sp.]|nr:S-layer homology domain-containing protein [Eubacterium sp.]